MNKKITRRVVLGTVLGGLAAGPFVIRALRRKNELEVTGNGGCPFSDGRTNFFNQWKEVNRSLSVKQSVLNVPKTITIRHDFHESRTLSFRFLETYYIGKNFDSPESVQPDNMMQYTLMEGAIKVGNNQEGKMYVSVDKYERRHLELDFEASRKNGVEITETEIENSDGTTSTIKGITKPSFSYDSVAKRYKADVVEKEVITPFTVGQFILNQSRSLDLDTDNLRELMSAPQGAWLISLARIKFCPLIRFSLPEHPIEVGKKFECPLNRFDLLYQELPVSVAIVQGMVKCNEFNTVNVVPVYGSESTLYGEILRKQYNDMKTAKGTSEENSEKVTEAFLKIIEQKENRHKMGVPNIKFFIDSEMGCVVRREEYDTSKTHSKVVSAVQRIFQLS